MSASLSVCPGGSSLFKAKKNGVGDFVGLDYAPSVLSAESLFFFIAVFRFLLSGF